MVVVVPVLAEKVVVDSCGAVGDGGDNGGSGCAGRRDTSSRQP